ncbi:MAG: DUF4912 domain-containing protein [Oscillatoria princeps RMCB-10]|nr:DUF4912 domain-containing protein [Oscillatoria princeps RMCB-10]
MRLYDVTGIPDSERHRLSSLQQFDCDATQPYLLLTLPAENRDYAVELGYFTESGNWVALMGSEAVRVVASAPTDHALTANGKNGSQATWLVQTSSTAASPAPALSGSRLFLVAYDGRNACVYWQIAPAEMGAFQRQGGEKLMLRLYDVTGISDSERYRLRSLQHFDCEGQQTYLLLSLPAENRDYMVELGCFTQLGDWMPLIWSERVQYQLHHN